MMRINNMKDEYDFSKGERGKFYSESIKMNLPVYLDDDVREFVENLAKRKKIDVQTAVNQLLKIDKQLAEAVR